MASKETVCRPSLAIWTQANIPLASLLEAKELESQLWKPEQACSRRIRCPSWTRACACWRGGGCSWHLEGRRRRQRTVVLATAFLRRWTGLKQGKGYVWVVTLPRLERRGRTDLFQWPWEGGLLPGNGGFFCSYPGLRWAFQACSLCVLSAWVSLVTHFFEIRVQFSVLWLFWASSDPLRQSPSAVFTATLSSDKSQRLAGHREHKHHKWPLRQSPGTLFCTAQLPESFPFLNDAFFTVLIWYRNLGKCRQLSCVKGMKVN